MIVLIALLGLAIGSFVNVLIMRIPKEQSIVFPASRCMHCQTPLRWFHNIPLLSWLVLRGRCAFCARWISVQYPLVELGTMLLFVLLYLKLEDVVQALLASGVFTLLLALSVIDLRYKAVPDSLNFAALLCALLYGWPGSALHDALLFAGGFTLLRFGVSYLAKKEAMGEADILIAATMGAMVGIGPGLFAIFLSALLALPVFAIVGQKEYQVPFIPFLALALLLVFLFDAQTARLLEFVLHG